MCAAVDDHRGRERGEGFLFECDACIAMAFLQDNEGYDEGLDDDSSFRRKPEIDGRVVTRTRALCFICVVWEQTWGVRCSYL